MYSEPFVETEAL